MMDEFDYISGKKKEDEEHGEHYHWNFTRCITWATIFAFAFAFIVWIITLIF